MRNASARLPLVSAAVVWTDEASFIESTEFETSLLDSEVESWPAVAEAAAATEPDLSKSSSEASVCGSVMDHDGIGGGRTVNIVSVTIGSDKEWASILVW